MKHSEVTKEDCKSVAQLITMLQSASYKMDGKELCTAADTIRWLQAFAVGLAKAYAEQQTSNVSAPAPAPSEGLSVKNYNPGNVGSTGPSKKPKK